MIIRRRELIGEESLPAGAFADLSWTQIKQVCDAGLAQTYIDNGTWNIGDINTSVNYGSYTSGIQLVHCLTDTQRGSSYYNTNGHIVIQFVQAVIGTRYMSDSAPEYYYAKYFEGALHTACNTNLYNNLNSTFKNLLQPWTCYVSKELAAETTGHYGLYSQNVYIASPSIQEVGSSNEYNEDENSACFVLDYYSDSSTVQARRCKTRIEMSWTNTAEWWTRSPHGRGGTYGCASRIDTDGSIFSWTAVNRYCYASPIMVI